MARSMSYPGPNPAARNRRTGFAKTIAVVWTDPMPHAFEDQAASSVLAGVAEACAERESSLLLVQEEHPPLAACRLQRFGPRRLLNAKQ